MTEAKARAKKGAGKTARAVAPRSADAAPRRPARPAEKKKPGASGRAGDQALPIYQEIQRDIERKIMSGDWMPGDRVPAEHELVKTYNCSRMTVNKAISSLAASGMIVRKRRSGSFVAVPRMEEPLLAIQDIRAEILSIDRAYSFSILSRGVRTITDPIDAAHLGAPLGTRMLCLEVVHYADSLPFTQESRQINLASVPEAEKESFQELPPGTWLLKHVPWTDGEHSVRAISADEIMARQLRISTGTACISIARRTWRAGNLVTFVRLIYPGERHRFVVRFSPSSSGPNAAL